MARELSDWIEWLDRARDLGLVDLGLDRVQLAVERLELQKPAPFIILVGGTNGKGSVVSLLETILLAAGYSVGSYISPYLFNINEQFRINGNVISDEFLCRSLEAVQIVCHGIPLTYFELLTCTAAYCFFKSQLDIIINEVGMGGRLDATNIFDPDISVIASIGYDHQEWLGHTLDEIGYEKSGIMRTKKPVIYGGETIPQSVCDYAKEIGAFLLRKNHDFLIEQEFNNSWNWLGKGLDYGEVYWTKLPKPKLLLTNACTALQVLQLMPNPINRRYIDYGLLHAYLPGRYQKMQVKNYKDENVEIIVDVAHNSNAAEVLASCLMKESDVKSIWLILAMNCDKDPGRFINVLIPYVSHWVVTEIQSLRAFSGEQLESVVNQKGFSCLRFENVVIALKYLLAKKVISGDKIVVTGSFGIVSEAWRFLCEYKNR